MAVIRRSRGKGVFASTLRTRIALQRVTETRNATTGDIDRTWGTLTTIYADIRPRGTSAGRGRESVEGERIRSDVTHEIVARWEPFSSHSITTKDRAVTEAGRTFELVSIVDVSEQRRMAEIEAREVF